MSILKYLQRAKRMDDLIQRKATGNSEEFARKLGISRSVLMEHLRDLREMGAPIHYSEVCESYYYAQEFGIFLRKQEIKKLQGGMHFQSILECSTYMAINPIPTYPLRSITFSFFLYTIN